MYSQECALLGDLLLDVVRRKGLFLYDVPVCEGAHKRNPTEYVKILEGLWRSLLEGFWNDMMSTGCLLHHLLIVVRDSLEWGRQSGGHQRKRHTTTVCLIFQASR